MSSASDSERLRRMALDHLWMHNADWVQMDRDGEPLIIVEGSGVRVTDADGNSWIDVNGGYASVSAGYGRQDLATAAYEQMQRITFFPMRTANPPTIRLAAKLAEIMPGSLSRVFPVSGGSEANEAALKIARAYHRRRGEHGRYKVISRRGSYHGATGGVMFLGSAYGATRADYEPEPPGMVYAPQPNAYRCEFGSESVSECAVRSAEAVDELIRFHGAETVAAVIAEPVASGPGAVVPGEEYWPLLREICDRHGVLLIADEVINGFGRTGKMFALEHWNVVPDIMTIGKGMSSSYLPLGAAVARQEVADAFAGKLLQHVHTHAGHPVAAAVGLKNIEIIEKERLVENSANVGAYFKEKLHELQSKHEIVGDVRGLGLMLSLELVADRRTKAPFDPELQLVDQLNVQFKQRGLILRAHSNIIINMSPPLCITKDEVDEIVEKIDESFSAVESESA